MLTGLTIFLPINLCPQNVACFLHVMTIYSNAGKLHLSGNQTVTEYEMSGKPYNQKSGLINLTNERIFQVMTR